jgi:hypothetical protein
MQAECQRDGYGETEFIVRHWIGLGGILYSQTSVGVGVGDQHVVR